MTGYKQTKTKQYKICKTSLLLINMNQHEILFVHSSNKKLLETRRLKMTKTWKNYNKNYLEFSAFFYASFTV